VPHGLNIAFGWTAQTGEYVGGASGSLLMVGGLGYSERIRRNGSASGSFLINEAQQQSFGGKGKTLYHGETRWYYKLFCHRL
jgi:hypothetical protein